MVKLYVNLFECIKRTTQKSRTKVALNISSLIKFTQIMSNFSNARINLQDINDNLNALRREYRYVVMNIIFQFHASPTKYDNKWYHKFEFQNINFISGTTLYCLSYTDGGSMGEGEKKSNLNGNFNINRVGLFLYSSFALFFYQNIVMFSIFNSLYVSNVAVCYGNRVESQEFSY